MRERCFPIEDTKKEGSFMGSMRRRLFSYQKLQPQLLAGMKMCIGKVTRYQERSLETQVGDLWSDKDGQCEGGGVLIEGKISAGWRWEDHHTQMQEGKWVSPRGCFRVRFFPKTSITFLRKQVER